MLILIFLCFGLVEAENAECKIFRRGATVLCQNIDTDRRSLGSVLADARLGRPMTRPSDIYSHDLVQYLDEIRPALRVKSNGNLTVRESDFGSVTEIAQFEFSSGGNGGNWLTISERAFRKMPNLKQLYISRFKFTNHTTQSINRLRNLEKFSLQFYGMPELDLKFDLPNLDTLNLDYNQISNIKTGVFDGLRNLESLSLAYNNLKSLPIDLFEKNSKLKWLFLFSNKFNSIPTGALMRLSELFVLDMGDNGIQKLRNPEFENGTLKIHYLHLYRNGMTEIDPGSFDNLELRNVHLQGNRIKLLPPNLFNSSKDTLIKIDLSRNLIDHLSGAMFENLHKLRALNLNSNQITQIDRDAFEDLSDLEMVDLRNNPLRNIPTGLFEKNKKLRILCFDENIDHRGLISANCGDFVVN